MVEIRLIGLIFGMVVVSVLLPLVSVPYLTWHDQQRIGQVFIALFAFFGLVQLKSRISAYADIHSQLTLMMVIVLGAVSSCLAKSQIDAFAELSLFVISVGIGAFVFQLRQLNAFLADWVLGLILRILLGSMVAQFYVSTIAVWGHADLYFSPWMLLNGFSNMRHGGQFLTVVTPMLLVPVALSPKKSGICIPRWVDAFLIVSISCMIFVAGTRGSIAGWCGAAIVLMFSAISSRLMATRFLSYIALGYFLSWGILKLIEHWTEQEVGFRFGGAQVFGLSLRESLWKSALEAMLANPWLGVGPMHFASLGNPVATHPHQALLQIGCEWGIPVLAIGVFVACKWGWGAFRLAVLGDQTKGSSMRWAILFALLASGLQSMVDGVLVMPYVQIWLAVVLGWAASVFHMQVNEKKGHVTLAYLAILTAIAVAMAILVCMILNDLPKLIDAPEYCSGGPRFWCDGRI